MLVVQMRNVSEITRSLPPGIRFHPTDEELLVNYLGPKILEQPGGNHSNLLEEIDVLKFEPSELPSMFSHMFNGKELFFFCPVKRKYLNSKRSARTTKGGYWKHTGNAHIIVREATGVQIGFKNRLVFYEGSTRQGKRTDWVMHEYHLTPKGLGNDRDQNEMLPFVACRIKNKKDKKLMVGHQAPTPVNQEGEHSSGNPSNHAADNHEAVDVQPEMPVEESTESLLPLPRKDGILSTHNTTPACQPHAEAGQGSLYFPDFSNDNDNIGLDLGPIRSPDLSFDFGGMCVEDMSITAWVHGRS